MKIIYRKGYNPEMLFEVENVEVHSEFLVLKGTGVLATEIYWDEKLSCFIATCPKNF